MLKEFIDEVYTISNKRRKHVTVTYNGALDETLERVLPLIGQGVQTINKFT